MSVNDTSFSSSSNTMQDKLKLRSEMAQEIISRKPDFMGRWALAIFMVIILFLLMGTWFIKYPNMVEARATLSAVNAPKEIIPIVNGRIEKLFIRNDEDVKKGQNIAWLESTASHKDVIELSSQLDSSISLLKNAKESKVSTLFSRQYNNLGELQSTYQKFISAWQQFNDYQLNGFYVRKRAALQVDIDNLEKMQSRITAQEKLMQQEIQMAEESLNMNHILLQKAVISKEDYRVERSKFLNKQMGIPQLETSFIANENLQRDKEKEIDQITHDMEQKNTIFLQSLQTIRSEVDNWIKKYVVKAAISGTISFIIPVQENQFLQSGRLIGYINPPNSNFYADTYLSQNNFGKISIGLKVQLRFDAYPYQEMGFINGTLIYVSKVASDSGFLATIKLDKGLITNNREVIPYRNGLKAQAIIITKDMRLLERLYYNIVQSNFQDKKK